MGITGKAGNVRLTGTIAIPADQLEQLVPLLEQHIALTRAEPGCLHFEVIQDAETPELFHVSELFTDEAAFAAHQANGAARPWGPASKDLVRDFHKETL
ncbi:putative quinol monooxygenase [Yoonia sp. I 8.24]|uniref:putative quinol monooxygenase n=1 Tax=Yoonia sp. I 8.24 TaxID=1537229 RepID=UPI001EE097AD|nr:putative quinol monooxygenase [Yoonia sp. I 8.24]MCG3266228.1 antibiotic biosynthesis monooxygenase [Yoonia sp. I 8.24]